MRELGPLSEPFVEAARAALNNARDLSPQALQKLRPAVLQAAAFETERLRQAGITRESVNRLAASLEECSDLLGQAEAAAGRLLEALREPGSRLKPAGPPAPPDL